MMNIPVLRRWRSLRLAESTGMDRSLVAGGTISILGSWLYFNHVPLKCLVTSIFDISFFNGAILVTGLVLSAFFGWRYRRSIELAPGLHRWPLALMLGCGLGSIATQWLVSLVQLPVGLFLLGSYGLLGLWLAPSLWRRGLPVGIAIACLLPFGMQFSTGVGTPPRIATAHVVEWILHQWQISAISAGDVIVLDTGVAYVDLPCSGLKSMWTGTLFLLAATWLEGRQIGLRWLLVGVMNLGLLAIANVCRVLILTILVHVLHQSAWAEILHVPLGVMGFVMASLLTWGLLRFVPKGLTLAAIEKPIEGTSKGLNRIIWVITIVLLAIVPMPQQDRAISLVDLSKLEWLAPMQTQVVDLNPQERKFFASYAGVTTRKQQFQYADLTGTSVVVASPTWQAHHSPELCLAAIGYQIAPRIERVITPEVTARWLSLDGGKQSAIYWFQSATRTTDDYMSRFWDDIFRRESRWTMVSVVFDRPAAPDESTLQAFIKQTHDAIDRLN